METHTTKHEMLYRVEDTICIRIGAPLNIRDFNIFRNTISSDVYR